MHRILRCLMAIVMMAGLLVVVAAQAPAQGPGALSLDARP